MSSDALEYKEKYEKLAIEHLQLRHELDQLKRLVFGSRQERFIPAAAEDQLALGLEATQVAPPARSLQTIEYTRVKKESSTQKSAYG
jgi:transposase